MINRELSWLSFNERVLQEAKDSSNPLIERLRFLGIYSSNLDEFFRVRVANVQRLTNLKKLKIDGFEGDANKLLEDIRKTVIRQQKNFEETYRELILQLEKHNIIHLSETSVNEEQREQLERFFTDELRHDIVPLILRSGRPFPKLRDKSIYLAVKMHTEKKPQYALIEIPSRFSRFYVFNSSETRYFILLDDVIRLHLKQVFAIFDFTEIEAYTFKFTRDAELNLDDDLSVSFIEKIEKSLKNRKKGTPVRFVYDQQMPVDLQHYLLKALNLKTGSNAIPGGRYHNFKDFSRFPDFGNKTFVYPDRPPLEHPAFIGNKSILLRVLKGDVLIHFPYQQFNYVVDMLREAAIDPAVKSIKINIYRVAHDSQILSALMNAVSNGKEVVVFFELQARFDEENNLIWAERLKEHGARVIYGFRNLKVHSKLFQITRINKNLEQLITFVGTGNFHERTARVYTDLGLFTAQNDVAQEVKKVFKMLEQQAEPGPFKQLLVSPINNRQRIHRYIQQEIEHVQKGNQGLIRMKLNNLVDNKLIQELYRASAAGVKIQLLVRGVCCLVPGLPKISKNIEVVSILGRFLEHSRVMIFYNNGKSKYYVTSGDLMERNLDKRIEVGVPLRQAEIKQQIDLIFNYYWKDNCKARIIDKKQSNKYRPHTERQFHAQEELYRYYQNLLLPKFE